MSEVAGGAQQLLVAFEDAVHARKPVQAFEVATELVKSLCSRWLHLNMAPSGYPGDTLPVHVAFCERFAAAWATLMLSDDFDVRAVQLPPLLRNLQALHMLVQGTAEGTLDTAIRALNQRVGGNHNSLTLARLALLWVPESRLGLDLVSFRPHIAPIVAAQIVATVAGFVTCTPRTHAASEAAIAALVDGLITPEDYAAIGLSNDLLCAWMSCSYAPSPRAHEAKKFLNAVIDRAAPPVPSQPSSPAPVREKPLMVVPLDAFSSGHAMYRCYGAVIAACRERFTLVALVRRKTLDATSAALFDVVHDIDAECGVNGGLDYAEVMRLVLLHRPDIVFFPSVGMRTLTALLAQRRLAPVQVMAYGHPATTYAPTIDIGLLEEQWVIDRSRYSERIIALPRGTLSFMLPPGHVIQPRGDDDGDGIVRIAVPSIAPKWTLPFVQALQQVAARAGPKVEFHFFSGVKGVVHAGAAHAISRQFVRAVVHPDMPYEDYCRALARCDVHAGTFPFGGTNSLIDSLLHGLPLVCLVPMDARGAQDADFVERVGLPAWLVAADIPAYVDALSRLVSDRALLAETRAILADRDRVRSCLLAEGQPLRYAEVMAGLVAEGLSREP